MFFLLQNQNYISWFNARCLVSLSRECDLLSMFHAFVHMHLQKLSLLTYLVTLTLSAAVLLIYHLTCTHPRDQTITSAAVLVIVQYSYLLKE